MAVMPGAQWRPLPNPSKSRMARYDLVVIHTMVGSLEGTDGYFRRLTNGVNSHFGTGGDGTIRQWVDTAVRSGANGAGNHRAVTVENADMGPQFTAWDTRNGAAVPPFTPQQIEANARICAWAHVEHGVPLVAAPNSLPGSRGIAYHRQGIDPWRVAGGEVWSSSRGKVCPADRRVVQIPQIITRARQIAAGAVDPVEEIMAWYANRDEFENAINRAVLCRTPSDRDGAWAWDRIVGTDEKTGYIGGQVQGPLVEFEGRSLVQGIRWATLEVMLPALLAAIGKETDAEDVRATVMSAMAERDEALRGMLLDAVREGMAADNESTADEIVDRIAGRLAG